MDIVQCNTGNIVVRNHRIQRKLPSTMIGYQPMLVGPGLGYSMNGHTIHTRKQIWSKRLRVTLNFNFFINLRLQEVFLRFILRWSMRVIIYKRPFINMRIRKRPKTFSQSSTNRVNKGRIWMINEQRFENVDVDRSRDFE